MSKFLNINSTDSNMTKIGPSVHNNLPSTNNIIPNTNNIVPSMKNIAPSI